MTRLFQTRTPVHDAAGEMRQRRQEAAAEHRQMLSLVMAAQVLSFGALYLLPAAATASWIAALLLMVPLGALHLLGRLVRRTAPEGAADTPAYRIAALGMGLLFLSNMAVCLVSLTELTHVFFFPQAPRLPIALTLALAVGLGIPASPAAVPNTARFLRWFLIAAFIFCALTVLPQGEAGYLFPLLGYGPGHTLGCAVRAAGCVWAAAALPVLSDQRGGAAPRGLLSSVLGLLLAALFFLCCAFVLPGAALSGPSGYALRLQLLTEMSPNTLSWSLMLMAEMLLFLTAFSSCADFLRNFLAQALRARRVPLLPFALVCLPFALRGMGESEALFLHVLPWRYPAAAALLAGCLVSNLIRRKKGNPA